MEILCEVKKTNKQLLEYGERLGTLERRMASIEQSTSHGTPSSSCSDTVKTKVSPAVRVCGIFMLLLIVLSTKVLIIIFK